MNCALWNALSPEESPHFLYGFHNAQVEFRSAHLLWPYKLRLLLQTASDWWHGLKVKIDVHLGPHELRDASGAVFRPEPVKIYAGHSRDVLDISWSQSQFLLTASMDGTVKLWHVSTDQCLRVFKWAFVLYGPISTRRAFEYSVPTSCIEAEDCARNGRCKLGLLLQMWTAVLQVNMMMASDLF